ncbi:hypothetical protein, partial [Desulfomarina sp.]
MSKLFEALQKIEQQNIPEPPSPEGNIVKKQSARPFRTIFLILLFLIVLGGVILFYLSNHAKLYSFESSLIPDLKPDTVQPPVKEEKEIRTTEKNRHGRTPWLSHKKPIKIPAAAIQTSAVDFQIKHETNNFSESHKSGWQKRHNLPQKINKNPAAKKRSSLVKFSEKILILPQHRAAISNPEINESFPEKQEVFVDRPEPAVQLERHLEELKKTVQQILYQAEERRKEGDMEGAVILYRRAWKLKKSPATANNLAAG